MSRDLSHETREMLVLARGDAPSPKARDNMWENLEKAILPAAAVGLGTAAATVAKPAAVIATNPSAWVPQAAAAAAKPGLGAALASAKLAIGGALLGTAVVLSVAAGALRHRMTPPALLEETDPRPVITYDEGSVSFNAPSFPARFNGTAAPSPSTVELTAKDEASAAYRPVARASLTSQASSDDTLLREASLVSEARSALLRGDPQTALVSVQAARREGRNLEPEELSIEARALRALGRDPEAAQLDTTLRSRYPNHALARSN
ncbi:hypothetical protein LVJ94_42705 [Pendulispora rubella]|uniref:Uncharacterized protein n=1 Tax=Pendulispora rubella TaxID=2741070 RepID=A0ABZ2KYL4_9BACT